MTDRTESIFTDQTDIKVCQNQGFRIKSMLDLLPLVKDDIIFFSMVLKCLFRDVIHHPTVVDIQIDTSIYIIYVFNFPHFLFYI